MLPSMSAWMRRGTQYTRPSRAMSCSTLKHRQPHQQCLWAKASEIDKQNRAVHLTNNTRMLRLAFSLVPLLTAVLGR
jgi:hypothetical protein